MFYGIQNEIDDFDVTFGGSPPFQVPHGSTHELNTVFYTLRILGFLGFGGIKKLLKIC
jgi:hypothetical protein